MNCIKMLLYSGFIMFFIVLQAENKKISAVKKDDLILPFKLVLSLDLLKLELNHYKNQFIGNWSNNTHAKVITEEAEILVQTTKKSLQETLKKQITTAFLKEAQATIYFNPDNIIIPVIKPTNMLS